jgi:hypothetical protein
LPKNAAFSDMETVNFYKSGVSARIAYLMAFFALSYRSYVIDIYKLYQL